MRLSRASKEKDEVRWLMAREIPRLRRYALALTNDLAAADDLTQDCLERAIRKRHQLRKFGSLRVWLYRILYTTFLNQRRGLANLRPHLTIEDMPEAPSIEPSQEDAVSFREVTEAMMTLPPDQRAVMALVAVEGLSYDEAASALDLPIGTVRSRLSRAREALRIAYVGDGVPEEEGRPKLRIVKS